MLRALSHINALSVPLQCTQRLNSGRTTGRDSAGDRGSRGKDDGRYRDDQPIEASDVNEDRGEGDRNHDRQRHAERYPSARQEETVAKQGGGWPSSRRTQHPDRSTQ